MTPATPEDLRRQLDDPGHVYVLLRPGAYFCHAPWTTGPKGGREENPLGGQPVRFTRLAATRFLESVGAEHPKARVVAIPRVGAVVRAQGGAGDNGY